MVQGSCLFQYQSSCTRNCGSHKVILHVFWRILKQQLSWIYFLTLVSKVKLKLKIQHFIPIFSSLSKEFFKFLVEASTILLMIQRRIWRHRVPKRQQHDQLLRFPSWWFNLIRQICQWLRNLLSEFRLQLNQQVCFLFFNKRHLLLFS